MPTKVKPVPKGYHTVTPSLIVSDAKQAIDFYRRAFGAEEIYRFETPDGKIAHAEIRIGDSIIWLADEMPGACCRSPQALGGTAVNITLYVEDADQLFQRATAAGATVRMPLQDMFWGDRYGEVTDPFGHSWSLSTHKEDVPPEEIRKRAEKAMSQMAHPPA